MWPQPVTIMFLPYLTQFKPYCGSILSQERWNMAILILNYAHRLIILYNQLIHFSYKALSLKFKELCDWKINAVIWKPPHKNRLGHLHFSAQYLLLMFDECLMIAIETKGKLNFMLNKLKTHTYTQSYSFPLPISTSALKYTILTKMA